MRTDKSADLASVLRSSSFDWDDLKNSPRPAAVWLVLPEELLIPLRHFLMGLGKDERGQHRVLLTVDEAAEFYE